MGGLTVQKICAALLSLVISVSSVAIAQPVDSDEQWPQPSETAAGHYSILMQEDRPSWAGQSMLVATLPNEQVLCSSSNDQDCAKASSYYYQALLPLCGGETYTNCIEQVGVTRADGYTFNGLFKEYTVPNHSNLYAPNPKLGIPEPASASVWSFPDAPHDYGANYLVSVGVRGTAWPGQASNPDSFYAYITPISYRGGPPRQVDENGIGNYAKCVQLKDPKTGLRKLGCGGPADDFGRFRCATWSTTDCLMKRAFPSGTRVTLKVRLSWEPAGWLHGRMKDPTIQIRKRTGSGIDLQVTAESIGVPTFYSGGMWDELPAAIRNFYTDCLTRNTCKWSSRIARPFGEDPFPIRNVRSSPELFTTQAMTEMALWSDRANDRAVAVPTMWVVRTLSNEELSTAGGCLRDGSTLKGVVTTNSTTYSEGPPQFVDGQLKYRVMSPHYAADGSVFRGTYNLLLRSDVARCIYGFSNAPIRASVEVVNEDGTANVATTVVSERDGWLSLAAHNFTFSAPTIQVTLTQPKPESASPQTVKLKRIACVRGKTLTYIKGTNPKCPRGFKRKAG